MKRLSRLMIISTLVVSTLGTFGLALLPVAAAPKQASTPALAALMPANTDLYLELYPGKLSDALNTFSGSKATSPVTTAAPTAEAAAPSLNVGQMGLGLGNFDDTLTKLLGHPATLQGDVLVWLNQVAIGIPVTDAMLSNPSSKSTPPLLLAGTVKDETAADKFITDLLTGISKMGLSFPKTSIQINGQTATRYDNPFLNFSLIRWPGYILIGLDSVVNGVINAGGSQSTLATDAKFQKTIALLNTESNVLTGYATPRGLTYLAVSSAKNNQMPKQPPKSAATPDAAATMTATMAATAAATESAQMAQMTQISESLKVFNGLAIGGRVVNKSYVLDLALSVDPDAVKAMAGKMAGLDFSQLLNAANNTVSGKLTSQIPAKAAALIEGHDLTRVYTTLRSVLNMINNQPNIAANLNAGQELQIGSAVGTLNSLEKTLKDQFGLDLNGDVLAPLAGDFALYGYLDPNDKTIKVKDGQPPFVPALLIDTVDAAKAKAFADKLAAGLPKAVGITPDKTAEGLYTLTVGQADNATKVAYGVSGNTFLLTTASALSTVTGAISGTNTLDGDTAWGQAKALLPTSYNAVLYLNVASLAPYMKATAQGGQGMTGVNPALMQQLSSALIYTTAPDANSAVITLALTLK